MSMAPVVSRGDTVGTARGRNNFGFQELQCSDLVDATLRVNQFDGVLSLYFTIVG